METFNLGDEFEVEYHKHPVETKYATELKDQIKNANPGVDLNQPHTESLQKMCFLDIQHRDSLLVLRSSKSPKHYVGHCTFNFKPQWGMVLTYVCSPNGNGKNVIWACETLARKQGLHFLEVLSHGRAFGFYLDVGFLPTSNGVLFDQGVECDFVEGNYNFRDDVDDDGYGTHALARMVLDIRRSEKARFPVIKESTLIRAHHIDSWFRVDELIRQRFLPYKCPEIPREQEFDQEASVLMVFAIQSIPKHEMCLHDICIFRGAAKLYVTDFTKDMVQMYILCPRYSIIGDMLLKKVVESAKTLNLKGNPRNSEDETPIRGVSRFVRKPTKFDKAFMERNGFTFDRSNGLFVLRFPDAEEPLQKRSRT